MMNLETERILITGGAGFIGSQVARKFVDSGTTVHVVDDLSTGRPELIPDGATFHETDVRSDEFEEIVTSLNPTIICHLAALHYIPACNENPEKAFNTNVIGIRSVLQAARAADGLERVVYASTAAVYSPDEQPHKERSEIKPTDVYGRTKLVGEDLAQLFHTKTDTPTISMRLFNVYGPNETNPHLIPEIVDQLKDGIREIKLGNTMPRRDFVHVNDVARAISAVIHEEVSGYQVFNVGTGVTHSVKEVVDTISAILEDEIEIVQDPDRVRESDRPHLQADIGRIRQEVGWEPSVTFEEGIRHLLEREEEVLVR